jgi:hypothetical protein
VVKVEGDCGGWLGERWQRRLEGNGRASAEGVRLLQRLVVHAEINRDRLPEILMIGLMMSVLLIRPTLTADHSRLCHTP